MILMSVIRDIFRGNRTASDVPPAMAAAPAPIVSAAKLWTQTPAHDRHNPELLAFLPKDSRTIVEVGCSSGALAKAYKEINADCYYIGVEIDSEYAELSRRYCDSVLNVNIEEADEEAFGSLVEADCWVFGDTLEHLKDPWSLLRRIRGSVSPDACIVACIPNAQHWSVQAILNCGLFRYEDAGLMDRTHLRWFTRITIMELFQATGFEAIEILPRIFDEPAREAVLPAIRAMALTIGEDPDQAATDAMAMQYVIKAVPV